MPAPRTFATQELFNMTAGGRAFPLPANSAAPIAVYTNVSAAKSTRVVASKRPDVETDGGVTLTTYNATPLAQFETFSSPDLRIAPSGTVAFAYLTANFRPDYAELSGDLAATPTDVEIGTEATVTDLPEIALALDGSGRPFVGYFAGQGGLRVASRSGSGWTIETVTSSLVVPDAQFALAVDASGQPYVFVTGDGNTGPNQVGPTGLTVYTRDAGGTWSSTPLDSTADDHLPRAIRAPSGTVMVLFVSSMGLGRATLRGGSWQVEAPLGGIGSGGGADFRFGFDVAAGPGDVIHVATDSGAQVFHYAYNDCVWQSDLVDSDGFNGTSGFGIELDAGGSPYIAYQKQTAIGSGVYQLWYATPQP
jgi:hypothetical protein